MVANELTKNKIGLNFRILVPQLRESFKMKVCLGEIDPSDIFEITPASREYLIKLIKRDVSLRLPLPSYPKKKVVERVKLFYNNLISKTKQL